MRRNNKDMYFFLLDVPPVPERPKIQNLKDTSAILEWDTFSNIPMGLCSEIKPVPCKYKVEACRLRSSESWTLINADVETTKGNDQSDGRCFCTVSNLRHGETYTFRVIAIATSNAAIGEEGEICSDPSHPSNPLTIPLGDIPSTNVGSTGQGALSSRRSSTSSGSGSCSGGGGSSQVMMLHFALNYNFKRNKY